MYGQETYSQTTHNLYNKLPEIYRVADFKEGDHTLLRYLATLDAGGIETLRRDILALYTIMSIEKAPSEVIPLIGNMLGFTYIQDLDERTQRKIIENLAELYKRKGTKSVINFITREFTEGNVKIIEMENRMFRTWAKETQLVPPSERHILSKTFNGKKIDENTFYLISKQGKNSLDGVTIIIESVTDLQLLNRLLIEFLPVTCKVHLQLMGIERFEESMSLHSPEAQADSIRDFEDAPLNVSEGDVHTNMRILDTETAPFTPNTKHIQLENAHEDVMKATINEKETLRLTDSFKDSQKVVLQSVQDLQCNVLEEEIIPLESVDELVEEETPEEEEVK